MANNTIWIEKFNISDEVKTEFAQSPTTDKTFLVWCLENGHVNEAEYLSWASQEYQLPVVASEFFANDEVKQNWKTMWVAARTLHAWDPSLLPLHESAGVVRVGCLEVPDLELEHPVAYVLAPLSGMRALWRDAFGSVEHKEEVTKSEIITSPVVVSETITLAAAVDVPPPPPGEFDANSLMASWGSPEVESTELPPEPEVEHEQTLEAPVGFEMPEGFNVVDIPTPKMESVTAPTESVVNVPIPQIDIPMPVLAKATPAPAPASPPQVLAQTPPPPPPIPEVAEQLAPVAVAVAAKAKPPIPPMAPPVPGKATAEYLGMVELRNPKDKLDLCQDLGEVACHAFSKFSRYFDRHMILLMKGFELRPHAWAGSWLLRSTRPATINLDQPSVFRIVSRTKIPYHGYTKPSVTNDMFFAEWYNGAAPAHLTIMPLLVNDQLIGMYLGATDGTLDVKVSLMDAERWIEEIALHINRTKSLAQKAAA